MDILKMTKRINGGTIGLEDRKKHGAHALDVLGGDMEIEPEEEKECFESVITSAILDYISEQGWIASANIDTEVNLNLLVDQDGMISMSSLDATDYVIEAIPNLEATLYEAINLIPQAEAGVKTNVGVLVTTSFTLPLRIFAQE